jgi:hypothetical protein
VANVALSRLTRNKVTFGLDQPSQLAVVILPPGNLASGLEHDVCAFFI